MPSSPRSLYRWWNAAHHLGLIFFAVTLSLSAAKSPNVLLILADDLGYGDVSCYGATAFKTPNIDRLAREGLRFTDAHAPSATCTPSRYSLMTGEYAWRRRGTGVLAGDASLIITPGRPTLASLMQKAGYRTGVVGKWHLGLGMTNLNWNDAIKPGPREVGFDSSFIMAATGDRVPCVYVENQRVVGLDPADPIEVSYTQPFAGEPTGRTHPQSLRLHPSHGHDMSIVNGISRIGHMKGGRAARWTDESMSDRFTEKAEAFIEEHRHRPFFLYLALHDPHVPRMPHPRFAGKSGQGPRGDAILQADEAVGRILATLDRLQIATNTLVLLTSDNGAVVDDGYRDEAAEKLGQHRPNGPFRGGKYSKFEGGTRVPFLLRWPGRVKPGRSDALISLVDLPASLAVLVQQPWPRGAGPDSAQILPALLGDTATGRDHLVLHANGLALREGFWKFIEPADGSRVAWQTGIETGNNPLPQLYDLSLDPGETHNLASTHPERVLAMGQRLGKIRATGGGPQPP